MKWINVLALVSILMIAAVGCDSDRNPMTSESPLLSASGSLASFTMPEGATLESATFFINVVNPSGQAVNIHRITSDWDEMTVTWNNFGEAFDASIEGTFMADAVDWRSVDITALVQSWMDGSQMNYGMLLDQEIIDYPRGIYYSSEASSNPPYMELCYTDAGGTLCEEVLVAADSYINEYRPDENFGGDEGLFTGWAADNNLEKQSLIAFDLGVTPPPPPSEGCTRTIGYWKNHAGFGPQDDMVTPLLPIWLGTPSGDKSLEVTDAAMAVKILKMNNTYGRHRNGITKLYAQLLAAKLNIANGADNSEIIQVINRADAFLARKDWRNWRCLEWRAKIRVLRWKCKLDRYNNGIIGPGHCDDGDDEDNGGHCWWK